jgi:hypothetical protein
VREATLVGDARADFSTVESFWRHGGDFADAFECHHRRRISARRSDSSPSTTRSKTLSSSPA